MDSKIFCSKVLASEVIKDVPTAMLQHLIKQCVSVEKLAQDYIDVEVNFKKRGVIGGLQAMVDEINRRVGEIKTCCGN